MPALPELKSRLAEIHALRQAAAVLDWDQQTYMPPGGVAARAEQKAVLGRLAHQSFTDPRLGELLHQAAGEVTERPGETVDGDLVRVVRRDYDRATRLPTRLVEELVRVTSVAQEEWAAARTRDDYAAFAPWLRRIVALCRETAQCLSSGGRLYDALLDEYEPGMTSDRLDQLFGALRRDQLPLVRTLLEQENAVSDAPLRAGFPEEDQRRFIEPLLATCGFDFQRGRQDRAVHPFCTSFSRNDVRLTTRYDPAWLPSALFGSLHEMGHGLYEQGFAEELEGTQLAGGASLGVHESQSRTWENLVGRSRGFWQHWFPRLQQAFPAQLGAVGADRFYQALNRVSRSLIRVEADEVTYNLHIMVRYELEQELLEDRLSVEDAPEAWNTRMQDYLGITPPDHRRGILQDVHWSIGILGYFPTYALGNLMSAQLWESALRDCPGIPDGIARGDCGALLAWLREKVHRWGRRLEPEELLRRVTGQGLTHQPYVEYLRGKFGEIYSLA